MKNGLLMTAALAVAAFLQACTGGAVTDRDGNRMTGTAATDLVVNFENVATGATYTTGVDSNGYFGFDSYAPASASNEAVLVKEGTYHVWVSSKTGGVVQDTPFTIQHTFNNTNCPDHYTQQADAKCALYQLELLGWTESDPPAPSPSTFGGYKTTVIPLRHFYIIP